MVHVYYVTLQHRRTASLNAASIINNQSIDCGSMQITHTHTETKNM